MWEIQKKITFLKQKTYEVGAKPAKLLAYRLRKQKMENTIFKVRDPKSNQIEDTRES